MKSRAIPFQLRASRVSLFYFYLCRNLFPSLSLFTDINFAILMYDSLHVFTFIHSFHYVYRYDSQIGQVLTRIRLHLVCVSLSRCRRWLHFRANSSKICSPRSNSPSANFSWMPFMTLRVRCLLGRFPSTLCLRLPACLNSGVSIHF